ncbi:IPIL1 protein, partial [Menura novaehollandiae]|nr:IPIL1 protein [Menura novaehollandiae]
FVTDLMNNFTIAFGHIVSNSFRPVPQRAIGVGSAFEGWSPRAKDLVYSVLVPLGPPPGHAFQLERSAAGPLPGRSCRIRVELECTCTGQQLPQNVLCFLHGSKEELGRAQELSLLHTLCTGSYLDVQKTTCWFYKLVTWAWPWVAQSRDWCFKVVPSRHTVKFQLTRGEDRLVLEVLPGVRCGLSDIFLSTQPAEPHLTLDTAWPECYAVAEAKFFQHVARRAPRDSVPFQCLQLLARILVGMGFSTLVLKTIVMHLLTTVPLSRWRRRHFPQRLEDVMGQLRRALQRRHLSHFIVGNRRVPAEISLPPDVQTAEPPNLFQHLAQDPAAHTKAMEEYLRLQDR